MNKHKSNKTYEGAEPLLRRALEARERALGPDHPDTFTSLNNLGAMLANMGNFCIIPWVHYNTWPNGNVYQCCITPATYDHRGRPTNTMGNLSKNTMEEIWNSNRYKELRTQLLNNEKPNSCTKCYEQEDNGITSFRQNANNMFRHYIDKAVNNTNKDGSYDEMKLVYWDFRFSNLCNMKCRMCGGHLSCMWVADENKIYHRRRPDVSKANPVVNVADNSIDNIYKILNENIEYVEEIYFAGGEPLIMDEHYYILEKLIEHGRTDVRIRYNTNLLKLKYKKWDNLELWKHFDNVNVIASIDSFGARAEYIRKGTVWDIIVNNIKALVQNDNIIFGISPTIQILNIHTLTEFIDKLFELGITPRSLHLNNVLTGPEHYHINTLRNEDKEYIKQQLIDHANSMTTDYKKEMQNKYNSIITYMNGTPKPNVYKKFVKLTHKLDVIRNESFDAVFPELASHYEYARNIK